MAAIGRTAIHGFRRDGVSRAEEHLNGPLCAAKVDLEALRIAETDGVLLLNGLIMSWQQTLTVNSVLGGCGKNIM